MATTEPRSHLDRLTEAASLLLEGRGVTEIAGMTGLAESELEELRRKILRMGVGAPEAAGGGLRRSGGLLERLGAALGWRNRGPAQNSVPLGAGPETAPGVTAWSPWQPVPAVLGLELRLARRSPPPGIAGELWLYEFRSTLTVPVTFRFRIATDPGGDYPRSVRALRPGEVSAGSLVLPTQGQVWAGTAMEERLLP